MACNASGTFSAAASTPLKFVESPHPRVKAARGRGVARKSSSCSPCRSHAIMPLPKTLLNQRGFYVTANNSAKKTTYAAAQLLIQINPTDNYMDTIKRRSSTQRIDNELKVEPPPSLFLMISTETSCC